MCRSRARRSRQLVFKTFITTTEFYAPDVLAFQDWFKKHKFPASNSPDAHILFLSMHLDSLNDNEIIGYKKIMLAYSTMPKNLLSKEYKNDPQALIDMVNRIY